MMHSSPSIASLVSQHSRKYYCFRSPPPGSGSASPRFPSRNHPPHTPFTHFVRMATSSLAYWLAFVIDRYIYIYMLFLSGYKRTSAASKKGSKYWNNHEQTSSISFLDGLSISSSHPASALLPHGPHALQPTLQPTWPCSYHYPFGQL